MSPALILSGGSATRLRPLTEEVPKALLPLGPSCVLELQLRWLRLSGVQEITIAAGPATAAIQERFGSGEQLAVAIDYLPEPEPLGSGGVLRAAARCWHEPFWVLNGDVVIDLDLEGMAQRHAASGAWASIALVEVADVSGFGVVDVGPDDDIRRFVEKPTREEAPSRLVNAGVWRFHPEAVSLLPPRGFASVEYDLFPAIRAAGRRLQGFRAGKYWVDMGTPERYLRVALDLVAGRLPMASGGPAPAGGRFIGPTARIDRAARLEAPCLVGNESIVAAGATVVGSVLWDAVRVGEGTRIEGSIIASEAQIGAGLHLREVVVGRRARVTRNPEPGAQIPTDGQA